MSVVNAYTHANIQYTNAVNENTEIIKKVDRDTLNIAVSYYWKASRCKTGVLWSLNLTQTCGSQSVVRICCENARLEHKKKEKYCSLNSLLVHWSFAGYDLQARLIARKKNLAEFSRH